MLFLDRTCAGRRLGQALGHLRGQDPVVLAVPPGGVPVGLAVAQTLQAPLDVVLARELTLPGHPGIALGAVGENGARVVDDERLRACGVDRAALAAVEHREQEELTRRVRAYRQARARTDLRGRTAVVVDDGVTTGSTARAACRIVRQGGAARTVLAVPVAPASALGELSREADELVCLDSPEALLTVGEWYEHYPPVTDRDALALLRGDSPEPAAARPAPGHEQEALVDAGDAQLRGHLIVPVGATGVVLFAHGSGTSRYHPRNIRLAHRLEGAGLGTLLFDLLLPREARDQPNVVDIDLLTGRLLHATRWLQEVSPARGARVGYLGAGTGGAAALGAAAELRHDVAAVVSRCGRTELTGVALARVLAPTLLVVGGRDPLSVEAAHHAHARLLCPSDLQLVPGASERFHEPGAWAAVQRLATAWFVTHLGAGVDAGPVRHTG